MKKVAFVVLIASLRVTAFAPAPASFFRLSTAAASPRWHTSSFLRPSSSDSSSSSSSSSTGGGSSSSSSDFSFNDLERELKRRRAEEAEGARREAEAAADRASAAAAAAVAAASSPGLEEGDAFMEEQMVSAWGGERQPCCTCFKVAARALDCGGKGKHAHNAMCVVCCVCACPLICGEI